MPFVPLSQTGAPFESAMDVDFFFVCISSPAEDTTNPLNNNTTYTFNPRYQNYPTTQNGELMTARLIVLSANATTSSVHPNITKDDASGTLTNWRYMRTVAYAGMYLSLEPDVGDEYYFDASANYNAASKYLWQCSPQGQQYTLRNTTTTGFILTSQTNYTFSVTLNGNPAVANLPIALRIRSTEPVNAYELPAGATYNLRSYFGGLLFQSFNGTNPTPRALFTPQCGPQRPASCAVCFKKVPPSQTASGTDTNTYVVYFPRGQATPGGTLRNVYLAIENGAIVCDPNVVNDPTPQQKYHFQIRLARDTFPNVPDNFGLFTFYHPQSSKYLASGDFATRFSAQAVGQPTPFTPPADANAAYEHHLLFFDFCLHCQPDVTPYPAAEANIPNPPFEKPPGKL